MEGYLDSATTREKQKMIRERLESVSREIPKIDMPAGLLLVFDGLLHVMELQQEMINSLDAKSSNYDLSVKLRG